MDVRREVVAAALAEGDALRLVQLLHEDFCWTTHLGETFGRR